MDSTDRDAIDAKAFRPKTPPLAIAALANLVLAAMCLGIPYYLGHARAEESLRAFSRFAGCLLGAEAQSDLGLGFPPDERDHFAAQVLRAGPDWPARCKTPLHAIAPDPAVFLWPSVKQAGADVRAVVALVEQELSTLARQRQLDATGRVPSRPLLAVSKLRAALTLFARAAGADTELDANAIRFNFPAPIALPARLPLMAGPNAALDVRAGLDGLEANAMDSRGISWLRVEGGKIDHGRIKRTNLVRATLRSNDVPWIVWAMAPERCEQAADHCAHRATGIAGFAQDAAQLPVPSWLGGHPATRVDRSLQAHLRTTVDLLALRDVDRSLEVRSFELQGPPPQEELPPLAAAERFALPEPKPTSALLLRQGLIAYTAPDAAGTRAYLDFYRSDKREPPIDLGGVAGEGAWVQACQTQEATWVAFGTRSALSVTRFSQPASATLEVSTSVNAVLPETPIALGDPVHASDPAHDRLHLWCDATSATAVALTASNALVALRCDAAHCEATPELAHDVALFDAKPTPAGATLIAYSQRARPQLLVARLAPDGKQLESLQTPAACWDPEGGMCGQPTLVVDSSRILLCARDGSDLLAIESEDGGLHWKAMSGLQVSGPAPSDINAPMRQHRLRKGLD